MKARSLVFRLLMLAGTSAVAATAQPAALDNTAAFEKAYAASFYQFDACGDGLGGRIFRNALADKLKQCPFSDAARKRFQTRAAAQRSRSSAMIEKLIENNGGLPVRLEGMAQSCRAQMDSPKYRLVRQRLDDFSAGKTGVDTVVTQLCDAPEIKP